MVTAFVRQRLPLVPFHVRQRLRMVTFSVRQRDADQRLLKLPTLIGGAF